MCIRDRDEAAHYEQVLAETKAAYQEQLDKQELLYNDSYLERMARERLGMVKEGETVISTVKTEVPETETDIDSDKGKEDGQDKQDKDSSDEAAKEWILASGLFNNPMRKKILKGTLLYLKCPFNLICLSHYVWLHYI